MTITDMTTFGALIVAIITIVFNFVINKDNLREGRENIAKEKSIEAYRLLVHKFLILKFKIINRNLTQAIQARDDCFYSLIEYRIFLPKKLHDDMGAVLRKFMKYTDTKIGDTIDDIDPDCWRQINEELNHIIERMQVHIGVEVKEHLLENGD